MTNPVLDEEKELSTILVNWGSQHDCELAGCDRNQHDEEIPPGKPDKVKRTGLARAKLLWKKHRKGELT